MTLDHSDVERTTPTRLPPPATDEGPGPSDAPARRIRRWPLWLVIALVGVLTTALVYGVTALLPVRYEGRIGLLAVPAAEGTATDAIAPGISTGYGEVVGLAMPSIAEIATSPSVLAGVADRVPGAPPADELAGRVGVELLSGAGVARLTVSADSERVAGELAEAIADRVMAADLLAPAGHLRVLDRQATVRQVSPDPASGAGTALFVGLVVAGLVAVGAVARRRRAAVRSGVEGPLQEALAAAGRAGAPVLDGAAPDVLDRIVVLVRAAGRPVEVRPGSAGTADAVVALRSELAREPFGRARPAGVLLAVDRAGVARGELDEALANLDGGVPLVAVVRV